MCTERASSLGPLSASLTVVADHLLPTGVIRDKTADIQPEGPEPYTEGDLTGPLRLAY